MSCSVSQTEEGKVRRELLDPISSGRRRYAYAKLFANTSEYLGEGVESVIPRERLNDDPHRVGAVLGGEWREPAFAERAPEQLHRSVLGGANAVFGKVGSFAVWAHDRGFGGVARGVVVEKGVGGSTAVSMARRVLELVVPEIGTWDDSRAGIVEELASWLLYSPVLTNKDRSCEERGG